MLEGGWAGVSFTGTDAQRQRYVTTVVGNSGVVMTCEHTCTLMHGRRGCGVAAAGTLGAQRCLNTVIELTLDTWQVEVVAAKTVAALAAVDTGMFRSQVKIHLCTRSRTHTHTHTHICMHACMHVCMHTHTLTHTHTHSLTLSLTHTRMHARMNRSRA